MLSSLFIFLQSIFLVNSLRLHYNFSSSAYYFSPYFPEGTKPNVTAPAVLLPDLFDPMWQENDTRLTGRIAIWSGDDPPGEFREDFVHRGAFLGLVGLIGWTTWTPEHFFEIDLSPHALLTIPYVTVHKDDMYEMIEVVKKGFSQGVEVEISLLEDSPNVWMEVFNSLAFFILWQVGLGISSVCLALLAAQKLWLWYLNYRTSKFYSQIAVLCLVVEFLCNIERAGFFALGGLGGTRRASWTFIRVALSISFPLTYLTTALTVAYIHEVLTAKSPMGTMIAKTKKPLFGLVVFYLLTDVPISIVSAYRISPAALILASASGIGITVGLTVTAVLLLYIVYKLRAYAKKSVAARGGAGKDGATPPPPDRLVVLLDRVQTSTYCLLFTTLASIMTQTPLFTKPQGFVAIQAAVLLGLMTTSYLHIVAYGRTPIRQQAKKEKEREKYLRLSQSTNGAPNMTRSSSTKPKFEKNNFPGGKIPLWADENEFQKSVPVTLSPNSNASSPPALSVLTEQQEHESIDMPVSPSNASFTTEMSNLNSSTISITPEPSAPPTPTPVITRPAVELIEPRRMTTLESFTPSPTTYETVPKNLMRSLDSAASDKPRLSADVQRSSPRPSSSFDQQRASPHPRSSFELNHKPTLQQMKTLESAAGFAESSEPQEFVPKPSRMTTLESALPGLPPVPYVSENNFTKPPNNKRAPTIVITDSKASASEWKDDKPPAMLRQSSFAATRQEQSGSPVLLEERGPWQVIRDGFGRTYYNNLLTRMTTWTDHTESVPPPYEELYPEGFGLAKAKVTTPDLKPVLLEERGEWMAILAPTGHVYYHNKLSRMQTWSDPTVETSDTNEGRRMLLDERGNWQEILDTTGKVYYNNKITRQQTWSVPEEMLKSTND